MNSAVANRAVLVVDLAQVMGECRVGVALQAEQTDLVTDEHLAIGATVRAMASLAAGGAAGGVFENKRSLCPRMAFAANRLGTSRTKLAQVLIAVRLVTTGALHKAFLHRVMEWQCEVGALAGMAVVAESGLGAGHGILDGAHGMEPF